MDDVIPVLEAALKSHEKDSDIEELLEELG